MNLFPGQGKGRKRRKCGLKGRKWEREREEERKEEREGERERKKMEENQWTGGYVVKM